jgi:peptidyl-prolyl isomerase D
VFGEVLNGKALVRHIENTPTEAGDKPKQDVIIADCGELSGEEYDKANGKTVDPLGDSYEEYPDDEAEEISAAEGLKIATSLKEMGNKAFQAKNFATALEKYQKGVRYIDGSADPTDSDPATLGQELGSLKFTLYNNAALMQIKINDNVGAIKSTTAALDVQGATPEQKAKAYYRRALARGAKKEDEEAVEDLEEALKLAPNDVGIKNEHAAVKKRIAEFNKKQKAVYSKFFD